MGSGALALGMIELKGKKLEANVNSAERAARLQDRLKEVLGYLVSDPIMVRQTVEQAMRRSNAIEPYDFAWMWQELGVSHLRK